MVIDNRPLGIRLNNPGNLRFSENNKWKGQIGSAEGFCQFDTPVNGCRAMMTLLRNYYAIDGLVTLQDIISKYAPPSENETDVYIDNVSKRMKYSPDAQLDLSDDQELMLLAKSMTVQEQGPCPGDNPNWYADATWQEAVGTLSEIGV
jgi:hypothetical protein